MSVYKEGNFERHFSLQCFMLGLESRRRSADPAYTQIKILMYAKDTAKFCFLKIKIEKETFKSMKVVRVQPQLEEHLQDDYW